MRERKCNILHVSKECVQYVDEFGTNEDLIRTKKIEQHKTKTNEEKKCNINHDIPFFKFWSPDFIL